MDLDRLITNVNSCTLDKIRKGDQFGIGVKIVMDNLTIKVREGKEKGWTNCIKNAKISADIDLEHFAIVSNN